MVRNSEILFFNLCYWLSMSYWFALWTLWALCCFIFFLSVKRFGLNTLKVLEEFSHQAILSVKPHR